MPAGLITLLDNYERSIGVAEQVTAEELTEINLFLDAVLKTEVMKVHISHTLSPQKMHDFYILQWVCFFLLQFTAEHMLETE